MALDRWEARLEDLFRGRPFDMLDAALADTVTRYPVDIQVSLALSYLTSRFPSYFTVKLAFHLLRFFDLMFLCFAAI